MLIETPIEQGCLAPDTMYRFILAFQSEQLVAILTLYRGAVKSHLDLLLRINNQRRKNLQIDRDSFLGAGCCGTFSEGVAYWDSSTLRDRFGFDRPKNETEQKEYIDQLTAALTQEMADLMRSPVSNSKAKTRINTTKPKGGQSKRKR